MTDKFSYPIERMHQTAQEIRKNANQGIQDHETAWRRIEAFIDSFPSFMQPTLRNILEPHDRRFRDSYQWQLDFADRLTKAADAMKGQDDGTARQFVQQHHT